MSIDTPSDSEMSGTVPELVFSQEPGASPRKWEGAGPSGKRCCGSRGTENHHRMEEIPRSSLGDGDQSARRIEESHPVSIGLHLDVVPVGYPFGAGWRESPGWEFGQEALDRDQRQRPTADPFLQRIEREGIGLRKFSDSGSSKLRQMRAHSQPLSQFMGQ